MSTLVTGGTGFLGRRLVERLLQEKREVVVLARHRDEELAARGVRLVIAPLEDAAAVRAACAGVETLFHVAARVGVWGPYNEFYQTNVLGTRAVLAGCREHGVRRLVYTSSPSVIFNGKNLTGVDESLPLTSNCPSPYPLTKAIAEAEVLKATSANFATVALRPHLVWGVGDPHLVPRILDRADKGRLYIVGGGTNRVDLVHVENAVDAHLLAEAALRDEKTNAAGHAYFITNGEPVFLWDWINQLLTELGRAKVERRVSLGAASLLGAGCEAVWRVFGLRGEPPITRFVAAELAKDHWFNISAAQRDLGYSPRISMADGMTELVASLRR